MRICCAVLSVVLWGRGICTISHTGCGVSNFQKQNGYVTLELLVVNMDIVVSEFNI